MRYNKDRRIRAIFPRIKGRTVIYLGDYYSLPNGLENSIRHRFSSIGYRFIVLPNLIQNLSPDVIEYLFPGFDCPDPLSIDAQIKHRSGLDGKNGFLYRKSRYWYFRFREIATDTNLVEVVDALIDQLRTKSPILLSWKSNKESIEEDLINEYIIDSVEISDNPTSTFDYSLEEPHYPPKQEEPSNTRFRIREFDTTDSHIRKIQSEIDRILRDYHLSLEELEIIIGYTVKLSKMLITRTGKIYLTDFGNKEIKMDHLTKMVYFFYLRHPEGIRFKEVDNYREELMHLYLGITGRDDPEEIEKSVIGHVDPYGSGLKVSASRIKRAFRDQFGEKVARFYCLEGKKGEPYSIAIDRDYVIWEYPE